MIDRPAPWGPTAGKWADGANRIYIGVVVLFAWPPINAPSTPPQLRRRVHRIPSQRP
jgi:hypothetical protein